MATKAPVPLVGPAALAALTAEHGAAAEHLAEYLGFFPKQQSTQPTSPLSRQSSEQIAETISDQGQGLGRIKGLEPSKKLHYWYVKTWQQDPNTRPTDHAPASQQIIPLPCVEKLHAQPPTCLLSDAKWQAFWEATVKPLIPTTEIDVPKAVEHIARQQTGSWPYQQRRQTCAEVTVVFDFSPYLTPWFGEFRRGLTVLKKLVGQAAVTTLTIRGAHELPTIGWPQGGQGMVVALSDLGHLSGDQQLIRHWQQQLSKAALSASSGVLSLLGGKTPKQQKVTLLRSMLAHALLPDVQRAKGLAWRIGATPVELLQAWNHSSGRQTASGCWQAKPEVATECRGLIRVGETGMLPENAATLLMADARNAVNPQRAVLEQLSLFDVGLAEPPDIQALEALRVDSSQPYTPKVGFWRASWPYLQQAETAKNHPSLQPVYEMAAKAVGNAALTAAPDKPVDRYQLQVTPEGLQVAETAQYPVIATVPSQLQDKRTGQQITTSSIWETGVVYLKNNDVEITLNTLTKPDWAERIWQEGNLIHAAHNSGAIYRLNPAGPTQDTVQETAQERSQWHCLHNPWPWANATGIDKYGLWADFEIKGVRQTLRFIPPGEFIQGSPESELDRNKDEVQRQVTLTRGFWLADTTCTQALWQAVMGDNPSHFKGGELPVERVSWEDCQGFFKELNRLIPELALTFPTEAQWEYACRAGTSTPFNWGSAELNSELANFNGSEPYANNAKSGSRESTVPVKRFPPNAWGLYQMHGNVWEWCADWYGPWQAEPATDPTGPSEGDYRSLRGGGWIDLGRWLRSADRLSDGPGKRNADIGLRVAAGIDPIAPQSAASRSGAGAVAGRANDEI